MDARITIGVAATRRGNFNREEAVRQKDLVLSRLRAFSGARIVDIDDVNPEGLLATEADWEKAARKFGDAGVDGVFFPHSNFGTEFLVGKTAKALGKPVLLWGPRDDAPLENGVRTRDTQCGLFATGKVLRRFNVPFSYIVNCRLTDTLFQSNFEKFTSVCSVVRAMRRIRILQVSTRPADFWTMMANEGELLEKFGVQVYPISMTEMLLGMDSIRAEKAEAFFVCRKALEAYDKACCLTAETLDILASMKVYLTRRAQEAGTNAVVLQCWAALQQATGIMPCFVNGLMTDEGLPVMCETDIHGAISSILLKAALMDREPAFFADLTVRHPEDDNAELLWHCGNFPPSLAGCAQSVCIGRSFTSADKEPGIGVFELKKGDITICRFDGDHGEYKLFMGQGKAVDGPATLGTYVWFQVPDWPMWEYKLVTGPYVHHVAGIYGKVADVLYEACNYIPGLAADPAQPTAQELEYAWIHG